MATKNSGRKKARSKKGIAKIPAVYMKTAKAASATPSQIELFGADGEQVVIKQTISPWDLIALSNFCISYSTYESNGVSVYEDRFFEFGYRLGVLMYFTNLDIESAVDQADTEYLVTGDNAIFWPVYEQINEDTKELVRDACLYRRSQELDKLENAATPLGTLISTFNAAFGENLSKYIGNASDALIADMREAAEEYAPDNIVPLKNGDGENEASGEPERIEGSDETENGGGNAE